MECIGTCELDLGPLWSGAADDMFSREVLLMPPPGARGAEGSAASIGVVRLTLVARQALATLRAHQQQQQG